MAAPSHSLRQVHSHKACCSSHPFLCVKVFSRESRQSFTFHSFKNMSGEGHLSEVLLNLEREAFGNSGGEAEETEDTLPIEGQSFEAVGKSCREAEETEDIVPLEGQSFEAVGNSGGEAEPTEDTGSLIPKSGDDLSTPSASSRVAFPGSPSDQSAVGPVSHKPLSGMEA